MFGFFRKKRPFLEKEFIVCVQWDEDACVWVATSEDIPGLVTEAETQEELLKKLEVMVPEMLQENVFSKNPEPLETEVPVSVFYKEQHFRFRIAH